jgi:hypothetical protein
MDRRSWRRTNTSSFPTGGWKNSKEGAIFLGELFIHSNFSTGSIAYVPKF